MDELVDAEIGSGSREDHDKQTDNDEHFVIDELGGGEGGVAYARQKAHKRKDDSCDGHEAGHESYNETGADHEKYPCEDRME